MDFEAQQYRDSLAKELKGLPKPERLKRVVHERANSERYNDARTDHAWELNTELTAKRLEKVVAEATSLEDLKSRLDAEVIIMPNDVYGTDYAEHVLKRIVFAELFGAMYLVPEMGGLRKKVEEFLAGTHEAFADHIERTDYTQFLDERFSDLHLTPEELTRIADKLPPQIFVSVDTPMERAAMLLNALEGTRTRFSCAGHLVRSEVIGAHTERYLGNAYIAIGTQDAVVADAYKAAFKRRRGSYFYQSPDDEETGEQYFNLYLRLSPPAAWLKQHGKRSPQEILLDCQKRLGEFMHVNIPKMTEKEFFGKMDALEKQYLKEHPEALLRIKPNYKLVSAFEEFYPPLIEAREYSGYFFSQDAIDKRDAFLHDIEAVAERHRK